MTVITEYTVRFEYPEDFEREQAFLENKSNDWFRSAFDTGGTSYTLKRFYLYPTVGGPIDD
mgnify:CR=1 FL=1